MFFERQNIHFKVNNKTSKWAIGIYEFIALISVVALWYEITFKLQKCPFYPINAFHQVPFQKNIMNKFSEKVKNKYFLSKNSLFTKFWE